MTTMDSPLRPPRSSIRHQLHLPVSLKLANKELYGQSENISNNGILLSSAFLIPEGSSVVIAVEIVRSRPGTFLSGRGKVVRAESRGTGDFALAIKLDRDFELAPMPRRSVHVGGVIARTEPPKKAQVESVGSGPLLSRSCWREIEGYVRDLVRGHVASSW